MKTTLQYLLFIGIGGVLGMLISKPQSRAHAPVYTAAQGYCANAKSDSLMDGAVLPPLQRPPKNP